MIDTHVHLDHKRFDSGRRDVVEEFRAAGGSALINAAISFETNQRMHEMFRKEADVFFSMGIHPNCVEAVESLAENERNEKYEELRRLLRGCCRVVAVGETGLDYHRIGQQEEEKGIKELQMRSFKTQLNIALEEGLPLILHIRDAWEDAYTVLESYALLRKTKTDASPGVVHCFNQGPELARKLTELGFVLGIGGEVTMESFEDLREAVRQLPMSAMVLETDSPFLLPVGCEGGRNRPVHIRKVAEKIAELKLLPVESILRITEENAVRVFTGMQAAFGGKP